MNPAFDPPFLPLPELAAMNDAPAPKPADPLTAVAQLLADHANEIAELTRRIEVLEQQAHAAAQPAYKPTRATKNIFDPCNHTQRTALEKIWDEGRLRVWKEAADQKSAFDQLWNERTKHSLQLSDLPPKVDVISTWDKLQIAKTAVLGGLPPAPAPHPTAQTDDSQAKFDEFVAGIGWVGALQRKIEGKA